MATDVTLISYVGGHLWVGSANDMWRVGGAEGERLRVALDAAVKVADPGRALPSQLHVLIRRSGVEIREPGGRHYAVPAAIARDVSAAIAAAHRVCPRPA